MLAVHLKKLRRHIDLSNEEEDALLRVVAQTCTVSADDVLVRSGEELNSSVLLLDGWLARTKDLHTGERQITGLHIPGDFADLHGLTLKSLDHDIVALSNAVIGLVPHDAFRELTERFPRLGRTYWLMTNVDAAISRELALSLGRRSALSRMAHLFCELHLRLANVGLADPDGFDFPLTQRELAECLGLTVVHANRTIQELRRRGLVELGRKRVTISDQAALEQLAEFNPAYLYLNHPWVQPTLSST